MHTSKCVYACISVYVCALDVNMHDYAYVQEYVHAPGKPLDT
jgi:hypothetical protein